MTTGADVVRSGLRLINVPGRGALLSNTDLVEAFERLQRLMQSAAVSKFVVPGIRRHFFALNANQHIYSYGPGGQLDTTPFKDPVPIAIEDGYIREGAGITDQEVVTNGDFSTTDAWVLDGASITNGVLRVNAAGTTTQVISLPVGRYTLRVDVPVHRAGSVTVEVAEVPWVLDGVGSYTFDFTVSSPASLISVTGDATSDLDVDNISILPFGEDRLLLQDGSDYQLLFVDQFAYNRRFTKGTGGRPYELLYSRSWPLAEVRFDNSAIPGDILVLDVLVDRISTLEVTDTLPVFPDAIKWLEYRLAYEIAPQYGKSISPQHRSIMREAYAEMSAGQFRANNLRADRALRQRPTFDINRGDP